MNDHIAMLGELGRDTVENKFQSILFNREHDRASTTIHGLHDDPASVLCRTVGF